MKGVVIAVVLVAVLGGVGFFVYRSMGAKAPSAPATTTTATQEPVATPAEETAKTAGENTVTYTASGFSPKTITIKVGEMVTFVNDTSQSMWIASAPHPIHTGLAGFDAKKGVSNGETYTFTFTKAGEFGFHNHLNPSDTGKVVVE